MSLSPFPLPPPPPPLPFPVSTLTFPLSSSTVCLSLPSAPHPKPSESDMHSPDSDPHPQDLQKQCVSNFKATVMRRHSCPAFSYRFHLIDLHLSISPSQMPESLSVPSVCPFRRTRDSSGKQAADDHRVMTWITGKQCNWCFQHSSDHLISGCSVSLQTDESFAKYLRSSKKDDNKPVYNPISYCTNIRTWTSGSTMTRAPMQVSQTFPAYA